MLVPSLHRESTNSDCLYNRILSLTIASALWLYVVAYLVSVKRGLWTGPQTGLIQFYACRLTLAGSQLLAGESDCLPAEPVSRVKDCYG